MAGLISAPAFHASPSVIGGTWPCRFTVSIRRPSSDHGRNTMSDRMLTPLPLATMLRTASTELVRTLTCGCKPACCQ
jgi:hypothetical protein